MKIYRFRMLRNSNLYIYYFEIKKTKLLWLIYFIDYLKNCFTSCSNLNHHLKMRIH